MNYTQSLCYLNSFLNLERILANSENRRWNLNRMKILLNLFDHPERSFFPILIAGTKGKGSTGFFLESILKASGISMGFYASPHLVSPRERIRIRGVEISKEKWVEGIQQVHHRLSRYEAPASCGGFTYFEIMTLLAAMTFKQAGVRIGIFEVGMGGRLDATNTMDARLALLTPIHLDHEAFLGKTVLKITREKAAIIRPGADVIVSRQKKKTLGEIDKQINRKGACRHREASVNGIPLGLRGDFQKTNAGAALKAARLLREKYFYRITNDAIRQGLQNGNWPGRFELLKGLPDVLIDGAHNPSSIDALVRNLKRLFPKRDCLLIFGCSRDKNSEKMLQTLSSFFPEIILTPTPNPRSQEVSALLSQSRKYFQTIYPVSSVREAFALAKKRSSGSTMVVATGSFYLIGKMRQYWMKQGTLENV